MKIIEGNLIELAKQGYFDTIVHGCNCFNTMGSGIAKTIKEQFPEAYAADCATTKGNEAKLGCFTKAYVKRVDHGFTVVNGYTQYAYGGNVVNVNYDAIRKVFKSMKKYYSGKRIGYPLIGAGLAKGDWSLISRIIDEELDGEDHTLVIFKQ